MAGQHARGQEVALSAGFQVGRDLLPLGERRHLGVISRLEIGCIPALPVLQNWDLLHVGISDDSTHQLTSNREESRGYR